MTYAMAISFQKAVYEALSADEVLTGLIGNAIYDAPLAQEFADGPRDFITIGEETARDGSTGTSYGAMHDFEVAVHSNREGFAVAKDIAAAVCDVLLDAELTLDRGNLVAMRFRSARARPGKLPDKRIISLLFRAVLEDDISYTG